MTIFNFTLLVGARYAGSKRRDSLFSFFTLLSIFGVVIGVALLLTVLSIMNGFEKELREKILGLVPQASIHKYDGTLNWQDVTNVISKNNQIIASAPFIQLNGLVNFRNKTEAALIYGIEPSLEKNVSLITHYISESDLAKLESKEPYIILGSAIAESLNVQEGERVIIVAPNSQPGSSPNLSYSTILKIINTQTELDSQLILTSLENAKILSGSEYASGLRLKLTDLFNAPWVVNELVYELGPNYYGNHWMRTHGNLYQAIKMSKNMVSMLVSLIIAIAAFNIVASLVMVVIDKEGDIAILRTMGASKLDIIKIFLVLGSIIGSIGTAMGVVMGILLTTYANNILQILEGLLNTQFLKSDVYPLTYLPHQILMSDVFTVSITAFSMCLLATLYPAWRASKVKPSEALRYE